MLRLERSHVPEKRNRRADMIDRRPIVDDPAWAMSSLPSPAPQGRSSRDLLLFGLVVVIIVVMNFFLWGTVSDLPSINPSNGRQVNQFEPWE